LDGNNPWTSEPVPPVVRIVDEEDLKERVLGLRAKQQLMAMLTQLRQLLQEEDEDDYEEGREPTVDDVFMLLSQECIGKMVLWMICTSPAQRPQGPPPSSRSRRRNSLPFFPCSSTAAAAEVTSSFSRR
jgi:hypothetical protein